MGDIHSAGIGQAAREAILTEAGCLDESVWLRWRRPVPKSKTWEGVYLDDHVISTRLRRDCLRCFQDSPVASCPTAGRHDDERLMQQAVDSYERHGLPINAGKRFRYLQRFEAWGTEVDGHRGTCGTPAGKRQQLARLCGAVLLTGQASLELMQTMLGSLVHPLMHAHHLRAFQHRTYQFQTSLAERPPTAVTRIPADIKDETLASILFLTEAVANMRAPVHAVVYATDSTPSTAGACRAAVPPRLARALYRSAEHGGETVRLDWSELELELDPGPMAAPDQTTDELFAGLPWRDDRTWEHSQAAHINLQEARAVIDVLRELVREGLRDTRVIFGNDSRVCVGAFAKGRSSSIQLNGLLREHAFLCLVSGLTTNLIWVGTASNPADYPSRHAPRPPPGPLAGWVRDLGTGLPDLAPSYPHRPAARRTYRRHRRPDPGHQPAHQTDHRQPDGPTTAASHRRPGPCHQPARRTDRGHQPDGPTTTTDRHRQSPHQPARQTDGAHQPVLPRPSQAQFEEISRNPRRAAGLISMSGHGAAVGPCV